MLFPVLSEFHNQIDGCSLFKLFYLKINNLIVFYVNTVVYLQQFMLVIIDNIKLNKYALVFNAIKNYTLYKKKSIITVDYGIIN